MGLEDVVLSSTEFFGIGGRESFAFWMKGVEEIPSTRKLLVPRHTIFLTILTPTHHLFCMMAAPQERSHRSASASLFSTCILCLLCLNASAFLIPTSFHPRIIPSTTRASSFALFAKKKSRKAKKEQAKTSGFGGKATEPCPCGSGLGYMKCCGKLHKDPQAYADATAEQVVRARYSAYAKREVSV